jgi:hypothetical protein
MAPVVTIDARMLTSPGIGTYLGELLSRAASVESWIFNRYNGDDDWGETRTCGERSPARIEQ